jgi:hypothetical protein
MAFEHCMEFRVMLFCYVYGYLVSSKEYPFAGYQYCRPRPCVVSSLRRITCSECWVSISTPNATARHARHPTTIMRSSSSPRFLTFHLGSALFPVFVNAKLLLLLELPGPFVMSAASPRSFQAGSFTFCVALCMPNAAC